MQTVAKKKVILKNFLKRVNCNEKTIYLIYTFFILLFIVSSFFVRAKYNYFVYGDRPVLEQITSIKNNNFEELLLILSYMGFEDIYAYIRRK